MNPTIPVTNPSPTFSNLEGSVNRLRSSISNSALHALQESPLRTPTTFNPPPEGSVGRLRRTRNIHSGFSSPEGSGKTTPQSFSPLSTGRLNIQRSEHTNRLETIKDEEDERDDLLDAACFGRYVITHSPIFQKE